MNMRELFVCALLTGAMVAVTPVLAQPQPQQSRRPAPKKPSQNQPKKVKKPPPSGPDLRVISAHVTKVWDCKGNNSVVYTVSARVKNFGNQTASVSKYAPMLAMRNTKDPRWAAQGDFSHSSGNGLVSIDPGKFVDAYFNVKRAAANPLIMKAASQEFEMTVDPDNQVKESNESNNRLTFETPAVHACFRVF